MRASPRLAGLRSRPATREAPRRASESVSVPMWHCRWTAVLPARDGRRGRSNVRVGEREVGEAIREARW